MKRSSLLVVVLSTGAIAQEAPDAAVSILRRNCVACHGAALQMSKLDLRTREGMLAGGERGAALVPGDPDRSRIYRFVAGLEKPEMPPGKPLPEEQVDAIRRWIEAGAPMTAAAPSIKDAEAKAALARMEERPITAEERKFWAFVPPVRHPVPGIGAQNPVDVFVRAALKKKGLTPTSAADRRTLIRRAYLDLTGLPPSPEQVRAFVNDTSANAFAKIVDELLASPHYGERWGRHWLDIVRYADSGGFEFDRDRANAWRYRDYVIRAFNEDKPYDRFVREQLAGDEFWPDSGEAWVATGYLRLGAENNLKNEQTRMDELDDIVATTSNAFLGLTVGCARCHNHKFDPIPQKDYYRIQAVFFPTRTYEHPLVTAEEVEKHKAEQKHIDELQAPYKAELKQLEQPYRERLLDAKKAKLPEYIQVALRTPPDKRTEGQRLNATQVEKTLMVDPEEVQKVLPAADLAVHKELTARIKELEEQRPKPFPAAMSIREPGRSAPPSYFLHRGSPGQKGSVMQAGVLAVTTQGEWSFSAPPDDARTSWRRRGFAEWVASAGNPLTARVMVNRIWQHHFGEGIVRTPNNFGRIGERPTHPELLDWLATEFVRTGWSVKAIHRLIMNSETYQMRSDDTAAGVKIDSENRLLWRMPRRRLEGENIRDSILAVAGNLDRTVGGPAVHPYIDPALFQASSKRTWPGKPDSDPSTWRRSVYVFSKRSIPLPMLEVFDKPDTITSCARRNRSTIAPQALILMNNAFVTMQAKHFAERLKREAGTDAAKQIERAFELALSRPPTAKEKDYALTFLRSGEHALVDFCQAVMNLNEFVYIP